VNSDCTATGTISAYSLSGTLLRTAALAGVFVNHQREVRYLFESLVLPNGTSIRVVITVDAKEGVYERLGYEPFSALRSDRRSPPKK